MKKRLTANERVTIAIEAMEICQMTSTSNYMYTTYTNDHRRVIDKIGRVAWSLALSVKYCDRNLTEVTQALGELLAIEQTMSEFILLNVYRIQIIVGTKPTDLSQRAEDLWVAARTDESGWRKFGRERDEAIKAMFAEQVAT